MRYLSFSKEESSFPFFLDNKVGQKNKKRNSRGNKTKLGDIKEKYFE